MKIDYDYITNLTQWKENFIFLTNINDYNINRKFDIILLERNKIMIIEDKCVYIARILSICNCRVFCPLSLKNFIKFKSGNLYFNIKFEKII